MKICSKCKEKKPVTDFGVLSKSKDGLNPACKECKRKGNSDWYSRNKESHKARVYRTNQKRKIERYRWKYNYLLNSGGCSWEDCTNSNPLGLELDHIDRETKISTISEMCRDGASFEKLEAEAAKCRVLCAYHHAIWTAEQMGYWSATANAYVEVETAKATISAPPATVIIR